MKLVTDTFMSRYHFRPVLDNPDLVTFECKEKELQNAHLNLREWTRQLEEEMKARGITPIL